MSRDFIRELRPPGPRLAADLGATELERGTRVRAGQLPSGLALPSAVADAPSSRAEPGAFLGSAVGWLGAAAVVGLAAVLSRRLRLR